MGKKSKRIAELEAEVKFLKKIILGSGVTPQKTSTGHTKPAKPLSIGDHFVSTSSSVSSLPRRHHPADELLMCGKIDHDEYDKLKLKELQAKVSGD